MTFSIKATIRAFVAPSHGLSCPAPYWRQIVNELERRGSHRTEAGAFLLGKETSGQREVLGAIFYDELDPNAYSTGACVLYGDAFAMLWALCRERRLTVVGDVHSHPGVGFQSEEDKTNPMVARPGHIALIVPNFARWPVDQSEFGIYEYRGSHEWIDRRPTARPGFFYTGFWS
jgi:proteasome lid subunit RPN8/RPN11